jgi:hypothetical protein
LFKGLGRAGLFCSLLSSGCFSELPYLQARIEKLERANKALTEDLKTLRVEVNDGLTLALCSQELRQLLENVQKECAPVDDPHQTEMCTTKQIRPAVIAADPEHKGRFLKLMSHLPHEVIYLAPGQNDTVQYRTERLNRLVRRALLTSTVFLVVSSPEAGQEEAERRAAIVEKLLLTRKVPPAKIHRWLYAFPANKLDIDKTADQPGLAETKDLNRGVWIFRADC